MSLIKCPDCQNDISDKSTVCPISNVEEKKEDVILENINVESFQPTENNNTNNKKRTSPFVKIGIIALIIISIIFIISKLGIEVPSLYEVTEQTAISILTNNSLIPNVTYEYSDYAKEGTVFRTYPAGGTRVKENSVVEIVVSKGPSYILSKSSTMEWWDVNYNRKDSWNFYSPYIKEGYLYIDCQATFGSSFNWKDNGFGTASVNDTFDKTVPLKINIDNSNVQSGINQEFTLVIPINDLDVQKPTTLYTLLCIERNGKQEDIRVNFTISW